MDRECYIHSMQIETEKNLHIAWQWFSLANKGECVTYSKCVQHGYVVQRKWNTSSQVRCE